MIAGYRFLSHYKHLKRNKNIQHGLEIIKIDLLIKRTRSSSVINQDFVFSLVMVAPTSEDNGLMGRPNVALYGWPEQTIPLSVSARNQTKDFWTWNLAVSGSGKRTRKRVDNGTRTRELATGQQRVGVEPRRDTVDSGDSSRQDRVQRRRLSQKLLAFQCLWNFR